MKANRTPMLRSLVAILVPLLLASACTGDDNSSGGGAEPASDSVPAESYMDDVCTALSDWLADFLAGNQEVATLDPNASVQQGKEKLDKFLSGAVNDTDQAIEKLEAAGTPDVAGGGEFSTRLVTALEQARDALENAQSELSDLPNEPTRFQQALRDLGDTVQEQLNSAGGALGEMIPALADAARNTPSCQSLGGAFGGGPPAPPS